MNTNDETKDKASSILGSFSRGEKAKRDVEILTKMSDIVDEAKEVKCTYRGNEKNPELMDFFLGEKYVESARIQPIEFLDFRAAKIEQGFFAGITYSLSKLLEIIQKDRIENESK
jgi:hypothetical protein